VSTQSTKQDLKTIRDLLRTLITEGHTDEAIEMVIAMLAHLQEHNCELALRLEQFRRERSGRRGEKIDPAQLTMMLALCAEGGEEDDVDSEPDEDEAIDGVEEEDSPRRRRPRRRRPPKKLPRDVIRHELSVQERTCSTCGKEMPHIGDDVSEILELVPAQFRVQEHRRAKYACPSCKETVKTAPGPAKLIDKGLPGPGLLTHVVVSKYNEHTPLYRLSRIYERSGVDVPVSTLCGWVAAVADEVKPIVDRLWDRVVNSHVVQTDASGLKVLDRDDPEGIRKGTMWCYVGDGEDVVFRYAPTGSGEDGPWQHLQGRQGYVQADAASVFDQLYDGKQANATEVGCWAHARRRFYKLSDTDPRAAYPLKLIGKLYRVERLADARGLAPEARARLRRERSTTILDRLKLWLIKATGHEPPQSVLHKACAYSLNQWDALTRFLEDGALALDNNRCESQIRSLALGRKNYLFAGSDAGADRAAVMYSLLRTCALQNIDGYAYLLDVIQKLADGWPARRIDELLPSAWAAAQQTVAAAAADPQDSALQATA
jgi:transposase